ncbi:phospodiesterase [Roseivivax halodurans JCM 10272]|uniref:Phospodiesterase n=1 Tax=Roseivivax halodurans JCM 10272 TaxID=1449350 RepID=X7EEI2_9RHOB|nr:phospodiesterase [Roseivivax halodurans JCM 10272]
MVHLSDLHFGRDRPELLQPLIDEVNGAGADLVVVSGDLTQRARHEQFRSARAFLDRLTAPVLAIPGNHDTPLDNLAVRLLRPWGRFRKHISRDLEPSHEGEGYLVAGMNTADPQAWQRGRLRWRSLVRAGDRMKAAHASGRLGVLAMHHPPEHMPEDEKSRMRGADPALSALSAQGADIVLCGHLHVWRAMPFRATAGLLLVQAGTGLSTRVRGEPNDLNILRIEGRKVTVERRGAGEDLRFSTLSRTRFEKVDGRWRTLR